MLWRPAVAKRNNNSSNNSSKGFVLLEVLVAVAVAGVILVALLRSFVGTWWGINTVREEAEAMLIARSIVNTVAPRNNTTEVAQQGTIGRYRWAVEVKRTITPPPQSLAPADPEAAPATANPWTLYRVAVVVTAPNGRRTTLATNRLSRPAQ
jgi:prepilin-type N-terminal cleavage/methylation domain-containing protein